MIILIDGKLFGRVDHHGFDDIYDWDNCVEELAKNDGFDSVTDFINWFDKKYDGKIIHWTDKKY